jgi:hypothetical protein
MIEKLTPTMLRDVLAMLREWRGGRLGSSGRSTGIHRKLPVPVQSAYARLYQVTAVQTGAGTCTVQRPKDSGSLDTDSELAGVKYRTGMVPAVGDRGEVLRQGDTGFSFHPGGHPQMVKAKAAMSADNTLYAAVWLSPAGVESGSLSVMRPNGITLPNGTVGFLGQTTTGTAMIIPVP